MDDAPSLWKHHTGRDMPDTGSFMSISIPIEYDAGACRNGLYCNTQRSPLQRHSRSQIELAIVKLCDSPQKQAVLTAKFARWCPMIPPPLGLVGKSCTRKNGTR